MLRSSSAAEPYHALSAATDIAAIGIIVRTAARQLAGSDGATFVLRDEDLCFYADEDSIAPLWKGQRFPIDDCISGWAMLHAQAAVVDDIEQDPRIPLEVYRPTYVRSLIMMPVGSPAVGAIGVYWRSVQRSDPSLLPALEELASAAAEAIGRIGISDAPWAPNFSLGAS